MKMVRLNAAGAVIGLGLASIATMAPAEAATVERGFFQNGGNACTGALPIYEGALRKRPKAIANEGTTTAFVTCSADGDFFNSAKPHLVFAAFTNRSTATVNFSCSIINGDEFVGSTAFPRTISLEAGVFDIVNWLPDSALEFEHDLVGMSCALPPGVEINYFGQDIFEDIGD